MTWPPPLGPRLVLIAGRNADAMSEAAARYLVGEIATVGGFLKTFVEGREVDDAARRHIRGRLPGGGGL